MSANFVVGSPPSSSWADAAEEIQDDQWGQRGGQQWQQAAGGGGGKTGGGGGARAGLSKDNTNAGDARGANRVHNAGDDGAPDGGQRARAERPRRQPTPLPSEPPFVAFVRNLDFNATARDVAAYFEQCGPVLDVRLVENRQTGQPKGFGYVEFETLDALKAALERNDAEAFGRPLRVDVAEPRAQRGGWGGGGGGGGGGGNQRRNNSFGGGGSGDGWDVAGGGRRGQKGARQQQDNFRSAGGRQFVHDIPEPDPAVLAARPKLELKPRSKPLGDTGSAAAYDGAKSNPFGAARPRDEVAIQQAKEKERLARQAEKNAAAAAKAEAADGTAKDAAVAAAASEAAAAATTTATTTTTTTTTSTTASAAKAPAAKASATSKPAGGKARTSNSSNSKSGGRGGGARAHAADKKVEPIKQQNPFDLLGEE